MNERNAKPNNPREENLKRNAKSKGTERNVERERKPKQKSRPPKVERSGNIEAQVVES